MIMLMTGKIKYDSPAKGPLASYSEKDKVI